MFDPPKKCYYLYFPYKNLGPGSRTPKQVVST